MSFGASASTANTSQKQEEEFTKSKVGSSQLQLEQEAVTKIIQDVLGSEQGLADIFSKENTAGIFDSSAATQAAGDLTTNLVGELAKLTGKTVTSEEEEGESSGSGTGSSKEGGFNFGFGD